MLIPDILNILNILKVKTPKRFDISRPTILQILQILQILFSIFPILCLLVLPHSLMASDFSNFSDFESDDLLNRWIFVGTTAKALGMGSASVAASAEADSLFWNPSALSLTDRSALSLSNILFLGDSDSDKEGISYREAGISFAMPLQNLGVTNKNFGVFGFSSWLNGWNGDSKKDRIISGGYGIELGRGFSSGIAIRHHRRYRNDSNGFGWGLGFGALYSHDLVGVAQNLSIGAAIDDIKAKIKWDGGINQSLPLSLKFGVAIRADSDTLLAADLIYLDDHKFIPNLQDRFRAHLGVERWLFDGKFGFRFGYTGITTYDRFVHGEWSRGISLNTESGELDYAYIKGSQIERGVHWITATLRWGNPSNDLIGDMGEVGKVKKVKKAKGSGREFSASTQSTQSMPLTQSTQSTQPTRSDQTQLPQLDKENKEIPTPKSSAKIDTQAPEVSIFAEPLLISPENLNQRPSALINQSAYDQSGIRRWDLEIYNRDQKLVGSFSGESDPPSSIKWAGWQAAEREYRCVLRVEDKAGNISSSEATLFVIDITGLDLKSEERGLMVSLPDSIFVYRGREVEAEASDLIDRVAYLIKAYQDAQVLIEVYSEDQKLAESRAKNLSNYLSDRYKIGAKRLISSGKVSKTEGENRVDLVILSEEGESQLQLKRPETLSKGKYKYTVLAGSFRSKENAADLAEALKVDVVEHQIKIQQITLSSGVWYRVVVGEFSNELEAKAVAEAVSKLQGISCLVIRVAE